ncbi:MAG TPA: glucose-1-phosphate adenylyltransferase [Anaerolineales bacterium]|nr:glucose-1-phosphate adenylyltransferase [Anaerolineales bacterium]
MPSLDQILAVILGGGVGKRLYPLTKQRAKPAVPIAGKYRLIDVPISNCINSGIQRIAVLTQFNSVSLHRHITQTYNFDAFHQGYVQILAAEQTPRSTDWYTGTADAVRKQLFEIKATQTDFVLILAGDHLYRMDYAALAAFHWEHKADITVAVQPVLATEAFRFGLLKRNPDYRIESFVEKPRDTEILAQFVSRDEPERPYLGSMGIYLFNTSVLIDLLEDTSHVDFGGQIIPNSLSTYDVFGYDFDDYWEDIGTIRSFYETNLLLAKPESPFNFYNPIRPIYTRPRFLPGSVVDGATLTNVLLAEGCQIRKATISNSVIGLRSQISDGVRIDKSIIMGSDYYDSPDDTIPSNIPLGIGANCQIEGAIIDKNARIGDGVVIKPFPRGVELDKGNWVVQDGIVVIPKSTVLHPGTYIGPD